MTLIWTKVARVTVRAALLIVIGWAPVVLAQQHEILLEFVPTQTTVDFTLDTSLHTVHGSFSLKHGRVRFDPATGAVSGEIVVDAASGHSGNDGRDRRMHREILESVQYPEITFRPDRIDGKVEAPGVSTIQVHGKFGVHGAEHEVTIPVRVEMVDDHWTASAHFVIPYVQWGIKNPGTFILHVGQTVDIDVHTSGSALGSARAAK